MNPHRGPLSLRPAAVDGDMTMSEMTTIQTLAPEDVREGEYVTVVRQTLELLPLLCDEWETPRVRRVSVMPGWSGTPLRVVRVCLPFVLTEDASGRHLTLDLRRQELARLSEEYGKKAFKCLGGEATGGEKRKK